jgi:hypothetical protein
MTIYDDLSPTIADSLTHNATSILDYRRLSHMSVDTLMENESGRTT